MKSETMGLVLGWALIIVAALGWIKNVVKLYDSPALVEWGGVEVMRVVGVFFAPLGAVLGWF
jgi:hypothetical protein